MDPLLSLAFSYVAILGLGAWLPTRFAGLRFAVGGAMIPIGMHVGALVFGLRLSWIGLALILAAVAGIAWRYRRVRLSISSGRFPIGSLLHPVVVLPALIAGVVLIRGDIAYFPYGQDEFTSWLYWPRQQFLADVVWRDDMAWNITGYTQGWPLSIVFAQTPWPEFAGIRAIAVAALWHVGLIGILYDVIDDVLRRRIGMSTAEAIIGGWAFVGAALAVEASWSLVPQLLQVEIPQVYFLAAGFAAAVLALAPERRDELAPTLGCGLLFAAAYLVKIANIAALAGLLVIAFAWSRSQPSWRRRLLGAVALVGPVLVAAASWSAFTPFTAVETCFTQLGGTVQSRAAELFSPQGRATAAGLAQAALTYLAAYKLPLTLVAGAGLALGTISRAGVVVALFAFFAVYVAGLLPIYLFCLQGNNPAQPFDSLQRYLMVLVRVAHVTGLTLLAISAIALAGPLVRRMTGRLRSIATIALACVAVAFVVWQIVATQRAIDNLSTRYRERPENVAQMVRLDRDAAALRSVIGQRSGDLPRVVIIAQGSTGYEYSIAHYLALSRARGDRLTLYRLMPGYSWGPAAQNRWMTPVAADRLAETFEQADIIWPFDIDDWMVSVLRRLVAEADCAGELSSAFLIRRAGGAFGCLSKENAGKEPARTRW